MAKVEAILEEIKGLTLLEASDLVKKMEEAFGVSAAAAAPMMVAGPGERRRAGQRKRRRSSPSFSPKSAPTRLT